MFDVRGQKKTSYKNILFQYSCLYIFVKREISRTIDSALERALSAACCVQVSKSHLLCGPRKSTMNIAQN